MNYYNIEQILESQQIVIFGCGKIGRSLYAVLRKMHGNICAITDNDKEKWGKYFGDLNIIPPEIIMEKYKDALWCIANAKFCDEIEKQLKESGIASDKVVKIDHDKIINKALIESGRYSGESRFLIYDLPYPINMKNALCKIRYWMLDLENRIGLRRRNIQGCEKQYKVSVCAIFKDEAAYMKEWIEFHRLVGIEHFYLYNNFSGDHYLEVLSPYLNQGLVTLVDWPVPQGQMKAYRHCFDHYRQDSLWIGMLDIDEFVVPIEDNSVYDFLRKYDHKYGSVLIYWKNFGTGGKIARPENGLVTENFTVCWRKHMDIGKCFVNTNFEYEFDESNPCFHHEAIMKYRGKHYPPINCYNHISLFQKYNIAGRRPMPIQINHYITKSYDEMIGKLGKGDVFFKNNSYKKHYLMEYEAYNSSTDFSAYKYLLKLKIQMGMIKEDEV